MCFLESLYHSATCLPPALTFIEGPCLPLLFHAFNSSTFAATLSHSSHPTNHNIVFQPEPFHGPLPYTQSTHHHVVVARSSGTSSFTSQEKDLFNLARVEGVVTIEQVDNLLTTVDVFNNVG